MIEFVRSSVYFEENPITIIYFGSYFCQLHWTNNEFQELIVYFKHTSITPCRGD